jgi:spore coat polysaccharide biosynthesis protein SpsF
MKIGAIIQARMSSERLPGKVLFKLNSTPILQCIIERISHSKYPLDIIVATSDQESDDPIAEFCSSLNIECFRGSLKNVALRYLEIIRKHKFDAFVRICGDSPFFDQQLLDLGIKLFAGSQFDIVTNVLIRTFPKGESIEIFNANIFVNDFKLLVDSDDLEHVTSFFYRNQTKYRIYNFEAVDSVGNIQLSIDTQKDFERAENIFGMMNKHHWEYGYTDIVGMLAKL